MSDTEAKFEAAVAAVKNLDERPDNETLLELYAFYKQATAGDVSGDEPGFFDFVGLSKYEAWERLQGMPADEAREQYITLVTSLGGKLD